MADLTRSYGHENLSRDLKRADRLARLLDSAIEVPVIGVRLGIDSLLGLVPGVGDATSALLGAYPVVLALRHRLPGFVVARLLGNIALDAVFGSIPLIGDVFDIGFKSNLRNQRLIERYAHQPARTERSSKALMVGAFAGIALIVGALLGFTILMVGQGLAVITGR